MQRLNLPTYSFKLKSEGGRNLIYDEIRRRYVILTPEEWVRQNFVRYLVSEKSFPASLIELEKTFVYNQMTKRTDVLVYDRKGVPVFMIECKAPAVHVNQDVFDQIALYNLKFNVPFLAVTNGIHHYCCMYKAGKGGYRYLNDIPDYSILSLPD